MARKCLRFSVKRDQRKSGATYWSVSGTINGVQCKRQFGTFEEADCWREEKEAELHGGAVAGAVLPRLATTLTPDQLRDAEVAMFRAKKNGTPSLVEAVDFHAEFSGVIKGCSDMRLRVLFSRIGNEAPGWSLERICEQFLNTYRPSAVQLKFADAVINYELDLADRFARNEISWWQKKSIERAMARLSRWLKEVGGEHILVEQITDVMLTRYMDKQLPVGKNRAAKTWVNYRSYLLGFFGFCVENKWITSNPAATSKKKRLPRRGKCIAEILSFEKATKLMQHVETHNGGAMVPFFVLTLFCGVRPTMREGEISKVLWKHISLSAGTLYLPLENTKTTRPRTVALSPNVVEWLKKFPVNQYPIKPKGFYRMYREAKDSVGGWGFDGLRHSFCTYLAFRPSMNVRDAAIQAGNSESVMIAHYLSLSVVKDDVERFWSIMPRAEAP